MKRIHLFEFEDMSWFPGWIRELMTRYIAAFHKILGTSTELSKIVSDLLLKTKQNQILDLCSGGGGPMPEVYNELKGSGKIPNLQLTLSDLYPNRQVAELINANGDPNLSYDTNPVSATKKNVDLQGLRTMICSFHHMQPDTAKEILANAKASNQPICIYEISDNSFPKWIWWIAIPVSFITVFFVTPVVKPMTWQQLVFTYLIPIIPIFIAWDGAVSNARTYTLGDLDLLLADLQSENYSWEKFTIPGKGGKKICLTGMPLA